MKCALIKSKNQIYRKTILSQKNKYKRNIYEKYKYNEHLLQIH